MLIQATSPTDYLNKVPADRKAPMEKLREVILENLPVGFMETMSYSMIGYVVPFSEYPAGYHVDPSTPLPFMCIASQKNFVALYHMGLYADQGLLDWLVSEYPKYCKTKLDMGKGCLRFKRPDQIPFDLIGQMVSKMSLQQWISLYEQSLRRK